MEHAYVRNNLEATSPWDPECAGGSKEIAAHTAAFKICYTT
jgi:hypothetical protein